MIGGEPESSAAGWASEGTGPEARALAFAEPVTRRALSSTAALLARSAWERLLSLVATLAVARLLTPHDVGVAALVLTITAVMTIIVDAGFTNSLVRRPQDPTQADFDACKQAQFVIAAVSLAAALGVGVGHRGFGILLILDFLQLLTDPLTLQTKVMLQRSLAFSGLALADAIGVLARSVISLAVAVVDRGPAALVLGDLGAAVVFATLVVFWLSRQAPAASIEADRASPKRLLREGAPFQLFSLINSLRDLSSSAVLSALVGLRALGLFQFAFRAMSPVLVIFTSLSQMSIPLGVRVIGGDAHVQKRVRQGYLLSGVVTAAVLAAVAAPAHWLVPHVFGEQWSASVPLVFSMALSLVINGPACTFALGLLLAANHTRFATLAAAACAVLFVGTLVALHQVGGLRAVAVAWDTSAAVEAGIVIVACRHKLGIALGWQTVLPIPLFCSSYLAGYLAAGSVNGWIGSSFLAAGAAGTICGALACPFVWRSVLELRRASRPVVPA